MRRYVVMDTAITAAILPAVCLPAITGLSGIFRRSAVGADGTRGRLWAAAGSLFVKGVRIWLSL